MRGLLPTAVLALLVSSAALAQAPEVAPTKDKEAVSFQEIERGVHVAVGAGYFALTNAPASPGGVSPYSGGTMARVEVGYDFNERISAGLFVIGTSNKAGSDYLGKSGGAASGDFSTLVPGLNLRGNLVGFADNQDVQRTWLYLRAGVGYALFFPSKLLPDADILLFGGPGVEYFTHLRHFSVAFEVTASYLVKSGSFGFAVTPNLRYAF